MTAAWRTNFAAVASGSATTAPVLTVPTGVVAGDEIVIAVNFITGSTLTATSSTSGSGTLTQQYTAMQGTSAQGFVFTGTGFVAGDTVTITPSTLNRSVAIGSAYSTGAFESVGSAGSTSTTVANCPSVTTTTANDIAVAVAFGIASATGRTFSSFTSPWNARGFSQSGSGTRFEMAQIFDLTIASPGASGAFTATASGALLSSGGVQLVITGGGGGGGTVEKVARSGAWTTATEKVSRSGTWTTATRKVSRSGSWT